MKKRYAFAGASGRAIGMYMTPVATRFAETCEAVGVFDINPLRMEVAKEMAGVSCPGFTDFDKMIAETKPDVAIVTTMDCFHHEYAIRAMEAGLDVVIEKPMTIDAAKCNALLETEKRTGRKVTVTFNYRYAPYATRIKELIRSGVVGDVLSVDFEWLLDTSHGADYFRRWHRRKENSGGLLVHKATHHFDIINWWIEEEPVEVMAFGSRRFYGPTRVERGERCLGCRYEKSCEFYWDITANSMTKRLYYDCESADGYHRDSCVFSPEIDIEDSMSVNVKYSKGTVLSYSLTAHSPYEGWRCAINGTGGRLECAEFHSGLRASEPAYCLDIYDRSRNRINYTVPKATGGHGGSDERLQQAIFEGGLPDPLGHQAGSYAGALSVMVGISANLSIAEGRSVRVRDLVPLDEYRK